LNDLPEGHPIITREALESIAHYAFSTLRGLTMLGGQVKIDRNLLSDMLMGESTGLPTAPVISILKPAALAYLEIESNLPGSDGEGALDINIDRSSHEYDFFLSHKSYALTINALAALAINRPVFFKNGAVCLARRCADPPTYVDQDDVTYRDMNLSKSAVLAIRSHIKASCLTLLRNALSVQTQSSTILHKVLEEKCNMKIQADKALGMAETTVKLKTAGRAARTEARTFYEWDTSGTSKRQRETDDALAKMRTAKVTRGLGHGIQLPSSTVDAIELIVENIRHLPPKRPGTSAATSSTSKKKTPFTLDFLVDAIMTNGASLIQEEGRWYSRDGGSAWSTSTLENEGERKYELNIKFLTGNKDDEVEKGKNKDKGGKKGDQKNIFDSQRRTAASEAVGRIVISSLSSRNSELSEFASNVAARLAWTLEGVPPPEHLKPAQDMALDSIESSKARIEDPKKRNAMEKLAKTFPLVTSCLSLSSTSAISYGKSCSFMDGASSLSNAIMNEAYAQDACNNERSEDDQENAWKYDASLDIFAGSVVHSSERCNDKPADAEKKRVATDTTNSLQHEFAILPRLSSSALTLVSAMCDLDDIIKKAAEAARKNSQQTIAASAALNAAKQAAEKRANTALLVLRDACFQRSNPNTRKGAIRIAVALAAGQANASSSCEDKALKLVVNMMYPRSQTIADDVIEAATNEIKAISEFSQNSYTKIQRANREARDKESEASHQSPFAPKSEEEKDAMDKARKPVILFMALCIRRPELIKTLFELSCVDKADVLAKTIKQHMSKLARAAGTKHGASDVALMVAESTTRKETPLLLSLLDTLAPVGEKNIVSQDFIDACYKIQEIKSEGDRKNPRFLIPVIFAIKRVDLVSKLSEFVDADSDVFMAALVKMAERLGRQALLFRDEPNQEEPSLKGMTYCEELVFLHKLDFEAAGIKQKDYLDAIKMCLDNEETFTDQVVLSALDHMSGCFLTGAESLPLAFMRTCILVCSKHESLHAWICHTLLPRLVDGKLYEENRLWEGWMRCAKMLENHADTGVSSKEAIDKLPSEQLAMYKARYGHD
jgi:symplekin